MMVAYLQNVKTKKKYRIVKIDKDAGVVHLKGELGEFTEKFDKEHITSLGYELVRVEE